MFLSSQKVLNKGRSFYEYLYIRRMKYKLRFGGIGLMHELMAHADDTSF